MFLLFMQTYGHWWFSVAAAEIYMVYRTIYPYYLRTGCVLCRASGAYVQTYITQSGNTYLQNPLPQEMIMDGQNLLPPVYSNSIA